MSAVTEKSQKLHWTPHPVWKIPTQENWAGLVRELGPDAAAARLREIWSKREEQIAREISDPLRYSYEPETFKKARALLARYDELYAIGGNREGKTYFAVKYAVEDLVNNRNRLWAFFHSSEKSSIRQQQSKVYAMLPPEWREVGRLGTEVYVKYTKQNGFSGEQFILPNGSAGMFFNYKQDPDVLEGYELDGAWFDELAPLAFIETMAFRVGQGRKLKLIVTFTPKNGYTPTVARAVGGAKVVETRPAPLLSPTGRHARDCPPGHLPYVMTKARSAALFFHLHMNPMGAGKEVEHELQDKPAKVVKERAYGWAEKLIVSAFPKYGPVHRITREEFEKIAGSVPLPAAAGPGFVPSSAASGANTGKGTRYCVADPGDTKNWFIKWYFCTPRGETIVYREWPDAQRFDEWALPPEKMDKLDWRQGRAQRLEAGRGMAAYRRLILELEGARWLEKERKWDYSRAEKIQVRLIDPRMGGRGTPGQEDGTSIIDLMAEPTADKENNVPVPAMHWEEAPDSHIQESLQLMQDAMDYDTEAPVNVLNQPKWFVVDDLLQSHLAYSEYTGMGGQKDALKDIVDPDRYFIKSGYGHVSAERMKTRGGMHY